MRLINAQRDQRELSVELASTYVSVPSQAMVSCLDCGVPSFAWSSGLVGLVVSVENTDRDVSYSGAVGCSGCTARSNISSTGSEDESVDIG